MTSTPPIEVRLDESCEICGLEIEVGVTHVCPPAFLGYYRTIVADPPWPFQWGAGKGGRRRRETELGYATMTLPEIEEVPVAQWAHPEGCHLFLWATDEMYREGHAVRVARAWGFEPCAPTLIWSKSNFGLGVFPRPSHEPLLVCRRGKPEQFKVNNAASVQRWSQPRRSHNGGRIHSAKPDGALDLIEQAAHGPFLEMFSRRARMGWSTWGNESLEGGAA
jgi:N6-adenosine-specific RNA methylase IME4